MPIYIVVLRSGTLDYSAGSGYSLLRANFYNLDALYVMEDRDNILDVDVDAIYDEDDDFDMVDVEEGELLEPNSQNVLRQSSAADINEANEENHSKNHRPRANKKKNKRKRKGSGSKAIDINRFIILSNSDFGTGRNIFFTFCGFEFLKHVFQFKFYCVVWLLL